MKKLAIIAVLTALTTAIAISPAAAGRLDAPWVDVDRTAPLSGDPWTRIDGTVPVRKPHADMESWAGE